MVERTAVNGCRGPLVDDGPYATFDPATAGTHTVTVEGQVDDDARVTVGPSLRAWRLLDLAVPGALLVVSSIAGVVAIVPALRQRDHTNRPSR